ncbi:MAG: SAM-dependent methyltransferase [Micavibrio aeruginosavorus]|uniref:SAM-dependent methyltransferase n=1 Tax=Micavibrio aeruginosavorus TaxID=349221 RepID=A0A2W5FFV9_9BACT|nr:MAG: SAM-dependent methyltransferase [Micavibrio aeruginosavorus]
MSEISVFNRDHLRQQRKRALQDFVRHGFLFEWASDQIIDRLQDIKKNFPVAYGIGNRTPKDFWVNLKSLKQIETLLVCDAVKGDIIADNEILPFQENSADLIISLLDLHTVNDLPGTLTQIRRILKPDGLFIGCMLGGETLYELRETLMQTDIEMSSGASPRVAPFADTQTAGALLQRAGFSLPVVDSEIIRASYQTMFNLMADLRGMGESNILSSRKKTFTASGFFARAAEYYQRNFSEPDNRVTASFEIIFMIGWAPHESQQKPLRRGSAEHSLSEFLK